MKNFKPLLFVFLLLITLASGCSQPGIPGEPNETNQEPRPDQNPQQASEPVSLSIVCTIFPQYDWLLQILGENAQNMDLTLLINSRVDLHSYQPTVSDIVKISTGDLFVYVGGASDKWVEDVLAQALNPDMIVINLIEALGDRTVSEETIEGMDHDHDDDHDDHASHDDDHASHDDDHASHDDDDHASHDDDHASPDHDDSHAHDDNPDPNHHEGMYDEHVWLSLRNAALFCNAITNALVELDPYNADMYRENLATYIEKLTALDEDFKEITAAAPGDTLLFADRFPFRYLVDDYGLNYYAAFPGCSAETEASFATIVFLAEKVDELGLGYVMITESGNESIAATIISNTSSGNQEIYVMDAMQSANAGDWSNGVTYLSIMESNLNVLRKVLS